ncbi:MAG: TetR/AcrR family transcriptional regulator [Fimbriimonadales bacterium]|nr:TetR/AcrR family transcriptional regulator [Fimbriimonadales bacterium]
MGRKSDARQRILDSALTLMNERGYTGVVVEDIMREANVGKSSFYHFFPSKDALGEEVMREYCRRWTEEVLEAAFAPQYEPLERPMVFVRRLIDRLEVRNPIEGFWPSMHAGTGLISSETMRVMAHEVFLLAERRFESTFQQAQMELDLLPNADPFELAECCVAYLHGLMSVSRARRSAEPMRKLGPLVSRFWEPYLA